MRNKFVSRTFAIVLFFVFSISAFSQEDEFEPVDLPDSIAEKVQGLDQEKIDFLRGEDALWFAERHELLYSRLQDKSPEAIEAYIDAMMRVMELLPFDPERDMGSIPLNTASPAFNYWKTERPAALSTPRAPGPINVKRYLDEGYKLGIPTFFNMPIALTPEDLVAGNVEVAIMGIGMDSGTGFRGAAYGPLAVRSGRVYLGTGFVNMPNMHAMVSAFNELTIVDYGDIAVDQLSVERSLEHIITKVHEVAAAGAIPMIVGGDHSLMYPDVAGVVRHYGKGKVGVVHFDAHYDAGSGLFGHLLSHGQPVRRLIDEDIVPGKNFIQVGLRGYWPDADAFEWMRENGLRYHPMAEVEKNGWDATMDRVLKEAVEDGPEYIYISFDVDVLDPAYMPGTGTPEPGGLTTREAFPIVRRLCAEKNVVGFELVELNPLVDPGYTSAQNADRVLQECLTGIAMRKRGLTEPHYLSPLTVDHGHDN